MYVNFALVTWALSAVHFGDAGDPNLTVSYRRLHSDLFANYNPMIPSVFAKRFRPESVNESTWISNGDQYKNVPRAKTHIELLMMTIIDVADSNQLIRSVLEYRLKWNDPRLMWNPSDYSSLDQISASISRVWTPAVFAGNVMEADPVADPDTYPDNVIIYSNGDILRVFTLSVLFTCTIRTGKFPFDMQKCSIDFDEYLMDPSETDLSLSIVDDAIFRGNGEWRIDNITNELKLIETSVEPYWAASVVFHMHRLSSYYVTLMIIPIQLITNVSVFALFWIEAAGFIDQTVVTLSSLISLLVLTDIMDKSVPKTGEIPNSAKHIWWNIMVMTLALCDVRLLTFLKKHDVNFRSKANGTTNTVFRSVLSGMGYAAEQRMLHLLLFQILSFLSLIVFTF